MTPHDVATPVGRLRIHVGEPPTGALDPAAVETIVMWPSLLMDASLWHAQVDHFSPGYRVVTVDPPGQGASDPLRIDVGVDHSVACLLAIVDYLGVERVHVLGSSWGAMVGGAFAALHPNRIDRLVLLNGTASASSDAQRRQYDVFVRLLFAARLIGGIRWPFTYLVVNAFLGRTTRRTRPEVVREIVAAARRNDVRSAAHAVRGIVPQRPDHLGLFGAITAPVLIVAGLEDRTFPLPEVQAMAGAIAGSQLVVISDAAHLVAVEVPDRVNALIEDFLNA